METLRQLNDAFSAPPEDSLWDDTSLDGHATWASARATSLEILTQLRRLLPQDEFRDTP